ncbi:hypothetical protein [Mangrovibacterium lignilyticum]|uniref:hypothetical protein n=1 Tax=Mangrovibacterium lignilyticum TaxID=2668052 RepID=UPI0013D88472|nr:hypothetical protein [Mangrovibacterium lignilyticum]
MEQLELKRMVNRQVQKRGMNIRKLARELDITYSGTHQLLDREKLQVQRLAELSEALKYNFFRELAEQFDYQEPDYSDNSENEALKQRVKELELEQKVLKEAISLMRS